MQLSPAPFANTDSNPPGSQLLSRRWVKADLHLHTAADLCDAVNYTAQELLEHAHALGFQALAITHHEEVFFPPDLRERARELGLLLIPGAELRVEGADVVALNLNPGEAAGVRTFDDLRRLRARRGAGVLTFAPHPFYIMGGSIGRRRLETHLDCFDAIELCHFHVPLLDPNAPAKRLACEHGKPLLATSDCHRREFFGQNYSWIEIIGDPGELEVEITAERLLAGICAGRIRRVAPTGGPRRLLALLWFLFVLHPLLKRLPQGRQRARLRRERERVRAAGCGSAVTDLAPVDLEESATV